MLLAISESGRVRRGRPSFFRPNIISRPEKNQIELFLLYSSNPPTMVSRRIMGVWIAGWLLVFLVAVDPLVSEGWGRTGNEIFDKTIFFLFIIVPLVFGGLPLLYILIWDYYSGRWSFIGRGYAPSSAVVSDRRCAWCAGRGHYVVDGSLQYCPACGGSGRVTVSYPYQECRQCGGTGGVRHQGRNYRCRGCNGTGWE